MQAFESAHPQFEQPFSIDEAVHFEPGTITAGQYLCYLLLLRSLRYYLERIEIARLQNSIAHLEATQTQLEQHIATDPDPDFVEALGDNRITLCVHLACSLSHRLDYLIHSSPEEPHRENASVFYVRHWDVWES